MPLAKCVRCDNLFDKMKHPVCAACVPEEEADYEKVRAVLEDHPDLSAEAVAELADVGLQAVMRMVDQGLVTNTSTLGGETTCGRCGAPAISASKKLCHACLEKLNRNVLKQKRDLGIDNEKSVEIGGAPSVREMGGASSVREMIEQKRL